MEMTDSVVRMGFLPLVRSLPTRILLVDDDRRIQAMIRDTLELEGYQVEIAENGQEALSLLDTGWRPKAILMDVMMPVMDGTACIRHLKTDPATRDIPVIAISAGLTLKRQLGELHQADALPPKPFELDDLLLAVEFWVKKGDIA